jgi:hypothetical protein
MNRTPRVTRPSKRALEASQALPTPITSLKRRQLRDPDDSQDLERYTPSQIHLLNKAAAEDPQIISSNIPSTPPSTPWQSSPLQHPPAESHLSDEEVDKDNAREDEERVDDEEFMRNERACDEAAHARRDEVARHESELPTVSELAAGAQMTIDPIVLVQYQLSLTLKGSHGRGQHAQVLDDAKAWPIVQGVHHREAYRKAITWCNNYPQIASKQWAITSIRVTVDYARCTAKDAYNSSISMLYPADD